MTEKEQLDYSTMQGMIDGRKAVSISADGQPCDELVRSIREHSLSAIDDGASPEEVIGMLRLEAMRMEQKLLTSMFNQYTSIEELMEEEVDKQ